jgi:CheY-like chemotaxis protein
MTGDERRRRVLVVDDHEDAATMVSMLVEQLGYEVRVVHAGIDAVRAELEFQPDVVLLDVGLPDIDGYEVARRIRGGHAGDQPFLVALTGWSQPDDKRTAEEAGFDVHLVKPADAAALRRVLDAATKASETARPA